MTRQRLLRVGCAFFFTVLFFASVAMGQTETATISGLITDNTGAIVPGAEVKLQSVERGTAQSVTTNNTGIYVFPSVQPGQYQLTVQKSGFTQVDFLGLIVNVQDHVEQNFRLQIGSVAESVTVTANGLNVNTTNATVSTVIDQGFISQLPLNGRSFNTLLQLTPGVVIAPSNSASPGQFSINGQRTSANYFQVDGVSVNFGVGASFNNGQAGGGSAQAFNAYGGTSSLVSVDAMQEFRVETSSFAAEYGHAPGGQVTIETRSGTNEFHGTAFDYFRNTVLDAANWFNGAAGLPRSPEHQNDFGGVFGGPIIKKKTFFFFSYEGLRLLQPQTQLISVPSVATRSRAIPAAASYLNAFPLPSDRQDPNATQFTGAYDARITSNATSIRIDHHIHSKWLLFGRFNYAPSELVGRGNALSEVPTTRLKTTTTTIGSTGAVTPRITNSLTANYSTQSATTVSILDSFGGATPPAIALLLPPPISSTINYASFNFSPYPTYNIGTQARNTSKQFNFLDDLSISFGRHQVKVGGDGTILTYRQSGSPNSLFYSADPISFTSTAQTNFFGYGSNRSTRIRFPSWALYAQDAWKIGGRLSLTYGLRWEFVPAPTGLDGTILLAWENANNLQTVALAPVGTPLWNTRRDNFAPRLGLAYRLNASGDWVVRGGWGIFYDLGTGIAANLSSAAPNGATTNLNQALTLPVGNITQYKPALVLPSVPYSSMFTFLGFSSQLRPPRSYQWNVAMEKSFGGQQSLSVTYVAQRGRDLFRQEFLEQPNSNFGSNSAAQLTVNGDTSDYSALQVQYRRPLSRSIQALLNYSWSHCIDTNSDDSAPILNGGVLPSHGDRGLCSFDVRNNFTGAVTYNLPRLTKQRVLGQMINNWSLDGVVQARSGFPIDVTYLDFSFPGAPLIARLRPDVVSGQPFWISGSHCASVYRGLGQLTAGQTCPGGMGLNPNAFDQKTPMNVNRQGTLGRNAIPGFGATQVDLSVMRKFPLTERINMQFRADIFNVLNHPNFSNPADSTLNDLGGGFGVATQMLNFGLGGLSPLYQIGGPRSIQLSLRLAF